MKRIWVVSVVLLGLLAAGLLVDKTFAAFGASGSCTTTSASHGNFVHTNSSPDDEHHFPFGFLCGGDPDDTTHLRLNDSVPDRNRIIVGTPYIDFTAEYDATERAAISGVSNPSVTLWVTVDINTNGPADQYGSMSGGTVDDCPGVGARPVVYNFQDGGGQNASPIPYNPSTGKGREDCGTEGKMIYWRNISGSGDQSRSFRLNLERHQGTFCVRANVSVDAGGPLWPTSNTPSVSANDGNTLSRVAKQSAAAQCYTVTNDYPSGSFNIFDCSTYGVTNVRDPNHPGEALAYRLVRNSNNNVVANGITDSAGAASGNATFLPNTGYRIQVWDPDILSWEEGGTTVRTDSGVNCSVDSLPYADRAMDCNTMKIHNIFDPDDRGGGVFWEAVLYDGQGAGRRRVADYQGYAGNHANVDIAINPAFDDNTNNGWSSELIIHNYPNDGSPSGPGTASYSKVPPPQAGPDCYTASCTVQVKNPIAGTSNGVTAGQQFYITATLTNLGAADTLDGTNFGVDFNNNGTWDWGRPAGYNHFPSGSNANRGGPAVSFEIGPFRAPDDISSWNMGFYADFLGHYPLTPQGGAMPYCSISGGAIPVVYKHFTLTPHAGLVGFDPEDPQTLQYHTWITDDEHVDDSGPGKIGGIPASTTRSLFKMDPVSFATDPNYGGIATLFDSGADNTTRILTNTEYASPGARPDHRRDYGTSAPFSNPPGYVAGDQFCARLTVDHGTGKIGPGDDLKEVQPATASHCPNVTNKPYFKVFGGNISAGGQFSKAYDATGGEVTTGCVTPGGEGIIAGYANTKYPGYTFGSSTQLTAQAMRAITGVASGQTKYDKTPYRLSFANTTNITGGDEFYSPDLGGNFNASAGSIACLTAPEESTKLTSYPIVDGGINIPPAAAGDKKVQFTHGSTPLTINVASNIDRNVSIFADGDVIIHADIRYASGPGGWTKDNVPSLVIRAKGNIYIDKDVGNIDGMFISQKLNGRIYTCSTGQGALVEPVPKSTGNYYTECHKQLTVHGSFVANRINLMRTYGTMRDEKPAASTGHTKMDIQWVTGSDDPNPLGFGYNCVNTIEGFVPNLGWEKAYLCLPASSGVHMAWSCDFDSTFTQATAPVPCRESMSSLNARGFTNCTQWLNPGPASWHDNMLCWDGGDPDLMKYSLSPIAGQDCSLTITQAQDPDWQQAYICQAPSVSPVMTGLPTSLSCSNDGGRTFSRVVRGTAVAAGPTPGVPSTCAAEVFDFSPEQYLSHPATEPPNKGAMVWDSVTSLPPVL